MNLKQTFWHALDRIAQHLLDPEKRLFYIVIAITAFVIQAKPLLIMAVIAGFYFSFKKRYGNLKGASLGELILVFMPVSLLYLMTWLCLIYGYMHTLHLPTDIGFLYGYGNWAADFDLIFKNSQAVVGMCSKRFIDVTVGEICTIIVPMVAFIKFQQFLMLRSGRVLVKKLRKTHKVK